MIVVTGLGSSGTTYYTEYLNTIEGNLAKHEYIYWNGFPNREPVEGQTHEVGMFAMPTEGDVLLVRDPCFVIPSVMRYLKPTFAIWTAHHLGFHPNTVALTGRAWVEWNTIVLDRGAEVLRIEDVPYDKALSGNSHGPHGGLDFDSLPDAVKEMAVTFGYGNL